MRNHLIIGLGGTGGKILRSLRKNIFQEFRRNDPGSVNLRYLYVDSDRSMMSLEDATWKTLGESVQLDKRSQLLITGSDLTKILNNLNDFPSIQPWIGSRQQWQDILGSIVGETLGGQKRRLGRFLFACKSQNFKNQLNQLVGELTTGSEAAVTFHICAGLAGGTGSGSVIDIVSQVRALYRDPKTYRIVIYALLPEEIPNQNWDTGNYHANGFAAIKELNALSVRNLKPHDVAGSGDRLELQDPFNGCYLFTNQNENGLKVDLDKQLPDILADFLFQKIVALRNADAVQVLERMENAENGDGTPETRPGANVAERSKRFLAFGIKRLAIPEKEIREYLTYNFARQAVLQLRFNNWDDTIGFRNLPRNVDLREMVKGKEVQERWMITDDHLMLSRGILKEEIDNKRWKPLNREWMDYMPDFVGMVEQTNNQSMWLNELEKLMTQRYEENFRGLGVRKFYEDKLQARRLHVSQIRRRIETELFEEWRTGQKSMYDIAREVEALLGVLNDRMDDLDRRAAKSHENAEGAEGRVKTNRNDWDKIGLLSAAFGRRKTLLNAHSNHLSELYIYRTQAEAIGFAKRLLQELIAEVTQLSNDVSRCTAVLDDAIKEFSARINERCNDGEEYDLRQALVRYYKPAQVKSFAATLDKKEDTQKRQAQAVRSALVDQIGPDPDFTTFHTRLTRQRFFDVMEKNCTESARVAHNSLVSDNHDYSPLFGVNVVSRLEQEYSGRTEDLRKFLHDFVSHAGYFLAFDSQEMTRSGAGIATGTPTKMQQFMVIVPRANENSEFAAELQRIIREQFPGDVPVKIIESDDKPNEITIVGLANLFPARYAKPLRFLKEKYDARIARSDNQDRAKLELHCEGDGTQLPELFVPDQAQLMQKSLPYLMLAKVMEILQPVTNPTTGTTELYLIEEDADGFPKHTRLGRSLTDVSESLSTLTAQRLADAVQAGLDGEAFRHADRRTELQARLREELQTVLKERNGNFEDPTYKRFGEAARTAYQLVKPN